MEQFLSYHRRMLFVMTAVSLAVFAALAAGMRSDLSWALGFALGAAAQLAKFALVDAAVVRKIAAERENAAGTQLKATFFSLFLFGVAVFAVLKTGGNVWAMAAGIFLPRLILIADAWIRPNPFGTESGADGALEEQTAKSRNG